MSKSKPSKHRRQLQRAKRREIARALRVRLHLADNVSVWAKQLAETNDLGILYRLVNQYGA